MRKTQVQPFKENFRSYATRLRTDLKQIDYQIELAIYSEPPVRGEHLAEVKNYLRKIEESLKELEKLE